MRDTALLVRTSQHGVLEGALLTVEFDQDGDAWIGTVLELGISTYADTLQQLRIELSELVELQLEEVDKLGFADEYLRDNSVKRFPLPTEPVKTRAQAPWRLAVAGV